MSIPIDSAKPAPVVLLPSTGALKRYQDRPEGAPWTRRKKALVMGGLTLGLWALILGALFLL